MFLYSFSPFRVVLILSLFPLLLSFSLSSHYLTQYISLKREKNQLSRKEQLSIWREKHGKEFQNNFSFLRQFVRKKLESYPLLREERARWKIEIGQSPFYQDKNIRSYWERQTEPLYSEWKRVEIESDSELKEKSYVLSSPLLVNVQDIEYLLGQIEASQSMSEDLPHAYCMITDFLIKRSEEAEGREGCLLIDRLSFIKKRMRKKDSCK